MDKMTRSGKKSAQSEPGRSRKKSAHTELGRSGEALAAAWLEEKGFEILHRNWRAGREEVDIIARRQEVYHFIEIKSGLSTRFGPPETRLTPAKLRSMMRGATAWLTNIPGLHRTQYDVLAITFRKNAEPEYFFTEDVSL